MQDFIKLKQQLEILWQEVEKLERETPEPGPGGTTDYNELSNRPSINGNLLTGNKTSSQLGLITASDITDAFTPSTISIEEGGTFPSDARILLTEHKPIMINSTQYWFLEESGVDYLYGSIPLSGAYPTITYFRVMKADFTVEFHETATDTVPTDNSDNFITSGGVYTAIQAAGGGGTDLTPVNVGAKAATFPTEYVYVLEKHLPFIAGNAPTSYSGNVWTYYAEDVNYYYYIEYLLYGFSTTDPNIRFAKINKSDKTWTQDSETSITRLITEPSLPNYAFNGHSSYISSTQNLNAVSSGIWFSNNSANITNSPTTNPFLIVVEYTKFKSPSREYLKQTLTDFTTNDVYYRTCNNGTWSSWYKITATVVS